MSLIDIQQLDYIFMLEFLHDLDLVVDVLEVVLIGKNAFFNHLDCYSRVIGGQSAQEDRGV